MSDKIVQDGITFDDVLLLPRASEVTPDAADVSTRLTRSIRLEIPVISAPMDTVTEAGLAIALAQEGGIGLVHRNMPPEREAREVATVKRSENGVIADPVALAPRDSAARAMELMREHRVSGFPVTEDGGGRSRVVGILTRRDMKFLQGDPAQTRVDEIMTGRNLVTASPATTLAEAEGILNEARVEKLLLVDGEGRLAGMITMRDIDNLRTHPQACRDDRGRLRVGGAVGVLAFDRVEALLEAEADVLVVDTAHGHSRNVLETLRWIKSRAPIEVIAGNVATEEGAKALIDAGADAIKVGIGPGSICTTRVVTGVGVPQITAIMNAVRAAEPAGVPVIADGGIRQSGDIAKALAAGASAVMLGGLFAGLEESPGELVLHRGRRFKAYRGMGSEGAMAAGSADRYGQREGSRKFVPEGVEGRVPYRGTLSEFVYQMVGGVRAAMGYCGTATIEEFRREARFVRVSAASVVESHPHDIVITRESSNYTVAAVEE
ncbi:MAG: IMP dehydrogenase [Planctomycetota bacterium]|jgi:IMP dehydrogenase|nr:IMP dehydrogenase [Planctomycetota bacterium]